MLWEEKLTYEEKFTLCEFSAVNINNCGHSYVRKHIETKGSDKYVILDISLKFGSLDNTRITYSEKKIIWEDQERG